MKKIFFFFALFIGLSSNINAQYFVSGTLKLNGNNQSSKLIGTGTSFNQTSHVVLFAPKVGYWLDDIWALGALVEFERRYLNEVNVLKSYGLAVFGRYKFYQNNKLSIFAEFPFGYEYGKSTSSIDMQRNSTTKTLYFNVYPVASYNLGKGFSLLLQCDFLNVGISSTWMEDYQTNQKHRVTNYGLTAKTSFFDALGNIRIGFSYGFSLDSKND